MLRYRKELPVAGEQYAFIAQLDGNDHVVLDMANLPDDKQGSALSVGQMAVPLAQLPGLARALPGVLRDLVEVFVGGPGLGSGLPAETFQERVETVRQQSMRASPPMQI